MDMDFESTQKHFTSCYDAESNNIFRYCLVRVSDREQALDITQETFIRLWKTLAQGKELENHRAFLFTVAQRLIIDWYRKKKSVSLESLTSDDEDSDGYEPINESALNDLELETEGRFLLSKISQLSPSYRNAVYLRFVEGLPPPDIAEILGISVNAASVRVNRGIEELRQITGYTDMGHANMEQK